MEDDMLQDDAINSSEKSNETPTQDIFKIAKQLEDNPTSKEECDLMTKINEGAQIIHKLRIEIEELKVHIYIS